MRNRFIVAGAVAAVLTGLAVPAAQAARLASPADCAGIRTVSGGFKLTRDVTCDFNWPGSNQILNLNRHKLTGYFLPTGTGQTVQNGSIAATNVEYWAFAPNFTMSRVTIKPAAAGFVGFMIEAGLNLTVTHSVIADSSIGLGFYFATGGTVQDTVFSGNSIGMTIQKASDVTVQRNVFAGNRTGLGLRTEINIGVNRNSILNNKFDDNSAFGINVNLGAAQVGDSGAGNVIADNTITDSGWSGINVSMNCRDTATEPVCPGSGNIIRDNTIRGNGSAPSVDAPFADDGVTARSTKNTGGVDASYPPGLAGLTLTRNTATRNADLGFDVAGVVDGGGNRASRNGNRAQCDGLSCRTAGRFAVRSMGTHRLIDGWPLFAHH